ncbi:transferase [Acidisoma sp. 7E03]
MKALILAAGRGSRMAHLTDRVPKALTQFNGRSLIGRQLGAFRALGVREIGIVAGYQGTCFEGMADRVFFNNAWEKTGIVASLECAASWLETDVVIVSYADIFFSTEAVTRLCGARDSIAVCYDSKWLELWSRRFQKPSVDAESFEIDAESYVTEIGRPVEEEDLPKGQYMGLLRIAPPGWAQLVGVLEHLPRDERLTIDMTALLGKALRCGVRVRAVENVGPWGEVDRPEDLEIYEELYPTV